MPICNNFNYHHYLMNLQTVRKAFEDVDFFAAQIGQPPELVQRFKTIWLCLTSGLPISPKKFGDFGKETKGRTKRIINRSKSFIILMFFLFQNTLS